MNIQIPFSNATVKFKVINWKFLLWTFMRCSNWNNECNYNLIMNRGIYRAYNVIMNFLCRLFLYMPVSAVGIHPLDVHWLPWECEGFRFLPCRFCFEQGLIWCTRAEIQQSSDPGFLVTPERAVESQPAEHVLAVLKTSNSKLHRVELLKLLSSCLCLTSADRKPGPGRIISEYAILWSAFLWLFIRRSNIFYRIDVKWCQVKWSDTTQIDLIWCEVMFKWEVWIHRFSFFLFLFVYDH